MISLIQFLRNNDSNNNNNDSNTLLNHNKHHISIYSNTMTSQSDKMALKVAHLKEKRISY